MTGPNSINALFQGLAEGLLTISRFVVQFCMAAIIVIVLLGVFFRYVLADALYWSEEVARYLMIWMGFLASGIALREGAHIAIDALIKRVPASVRAPLAALIRILCLVFLLTVTALGAMLIQRIAGQRSPALGINMLWPYLAIPTGCLIMAIEVAATMARDPSGSEFTQQSEVGHGE